MPVLVPDVCGCYPNGVPAGHRCPAKYVLVGEAPGKYEVLGRRPFVGPSGALLNQLWAEVGLSRKDFYISNVYPFRPPNNDISTIPKAELEASALELKARLKERVSPMVVIPTGATAFSALTGIYPRYPKEPLITKWRGSILRGDGFKIIPTIHPASVLRSPVLYKTSVLDWKRIKEEGKSAALSLPPRTRVIFPKAAEKAAFLERLAKHPDLPVAIDIETSNVGIICVGFACSSDYGISVLSRDADFIEAVCESSNPKALQNGLYDLYWLGKAGIFVNNYVWDVGAMFHALDPNAGPASSSRDEDDPNAGRSMIKPYSLAYMGSVFTRQPFWKDEAKDQGGFVKIGNDRSKLEQLMSYNTLDCMVTWEIQSVLEKELRDAGKLDFYLKHYSSLFTPILSVMLHGIRMDVVNAERTAKEFETRCKTLQGEIAVLAGIPLHTVKVYKRKPKGFPWEQRTSPGESIGTWKSAAVGERGECNGSNTDSRECIPSAGNLHGWVHPVEAAKVYGSFYVKHVGKSVSNSKLQSYLYTVLKLPKRVRKGKVTTDEAALRGLRLAHPETGAILDKVLEFRRTEKLGSFLAKGKCDADGRVRTQYKTNIQTGRLSSSENPCGTGMNLQNVDRELKHLFIPDPGCVLLEVDYSLAEDRVVKALTKDPKAIELARKHPAEFDSHTFNARNIFSQVLGKELKLEDVTAKQRYLGKRARYAKAYGMQAPKLQEILLKDKYVLSLAECENLLQVIDRLEPWILVWQSVTRMKVIRERKLANSWGRSIDFTYERMDDELYRRAYAWVPQSEIGDCLNQLGFIPCYKYLIDNNLKSRIVLQVHDALVINAFPEEAYDVAKYLNESLSQPRMYEGIELSIPVEVSVGPSWAKEGRVSWKRLPPKDEFDTVTREVLGRTREYVI